MSSTDLHLILVGCLIMATVQQRINTKKRKVHPITCHKGKGQEQKYSSTHSSTLGIRGGAWLTPSPRCFPQGCPGTGPGPVLMRAENLAPVVFKPWTVHPVVSCYTDYIIFAHINTHKQIYTHTHTNIYICISSENSINILQNLPCPC